MTREAVSQVRFTTETRVAPAGVRKGFKSDLVMSFPKFVSCLALLTALAGVRTLGQLVVTEVHSAASVATAPFVHADWWELTNCRPPPYPHPLDLELRLLCTHALYFAQTISVLYESPPGMSFSFEAVGGYIF